MNPVPFAFNRGVVGSVFPPSPATRVFARIKPESEGVVDAVFAPATYAFVIPSLDLVGSCTLRPGDDFSIIDFSIGPVEEFDPGSTPLDGTLLTKEFFHRLHEAVIEAGRTTAYWHPPGSTLTHADGTTEVAGSSGILRAIPSPPTGGRGKSRKTDPSGRPYERVWNDPEEIALTVRLMEVAEAAYQSPHYPADRVDLSTVAKRESWVAEASGIWSAGTVHVQLVMARKLGLVDSKRRKKS